MTSNKSSLFSGADPFIPHDESYEDDYAQLGWDTNGLLGQSEATMSTENGLIVSVKI